MGPKFSFWGWKWWQTNPLVESNKISVIFAFIQQFQFPVLVLLVRRSGVARWSWVGSKKNKLVRIRKNRRTRRKSVVWRESASKKFPTYSTRKSCTWPSGYTGEFCENKVPFSTSETCKTTTSTSFSYDSCRPCYIANIATIAIFATVFALVLLRRPQKYQAAASLHARSRRASMSKCTSQTSLGERHESLASLIDFGRNNRLPVLHGGGSIAGGGRG